MLLSFFENKIKRALNKEYFVFCNNKIYCLKGLVDLKSDGFMKVRKLLISEMPEGMWERVPA